jgi:DNA ligase-1
MKLFTIEELKKVGYGKVFIKRNDKVYKWRAEVIVDDDGDVYFKTSYGYLGKDFKTQVRSEHIKGNTRHSAEDVAYTKLRTSLNNKLKKDYSRSKKGESTLEYIVPMTISKMSNQGKKLIYPAYVQPKLNGVRAVIRGDGRMWSRRGKEYTAMNYISKEVVKHLDLSDNEFIDGEFYIHNETLQTIQSIVSKKIQDHSNMKVFFSVFDYYSRDEPKLNYKERYGKIKELIKGNKNLKYVVLTNTHVVRSKADVDKYYDEYTKDNYEGIVIKNKKGIYEPNKRTMQVFKLKNFLIEEYRILDIIKTDKEGIVFELEVPQTCAKFRVNGRNSLEYQYKVYDKRKKHIGKYLKILMDELSKDKIPTRSVIVLDKNGDYEIINK